MQFLMLAIWPYAAAAAGLGIVAGAVVEWMQARRARSSREGSR